MKCSKTKNFSILEISTIPRLTPDIFPNPVPGENLMKPGFLPGFT